MSRGLAALAVAVLCAAGCSREAALPLEQEKFVEVMVSLRRAALESSGQEEFETRKQSILKQAGVTEQQLQAYAREAPRDPRGLSTAYDSITARLGRLSEPE